MERSSRCTRSYHPYYCIQHGMHAVFVSFVEKIKKFPHCRICVEIVNPCRLYNIIWNRLNNVCCIAEFTALSYHKNCENNIATEITRQLASQNLCFSDVHWWTVGLCCLNFHILQIQPRTYHQDHTKRSFTLHRPQCTFVHDPSAPRDAFSESCPPCSVPYIVYAYEFTTTGVYSPISCPRQRTCTDPQTPWRSVPAWPRPWPAWGYLPLSGPSWCHEGVRSPTGVEASYIHLPTDRKLS